MSEQWVTMYLYQRELLECTKCRVYLKDQEVYMYVNADRVEDILCEKCWKAQQEKREVNVH